MTAPTLAVFASLLGVLLGVIGTLSATWIQQRAENSRSLLRLKDDRRKEQLALVAEFLVAEMKTWDTLQGLATANMILSVSEDDPTGLRKIRGKYVEVMKDTMDEMSEKGAMIGIVVPELKDIVEHMQQICTDTLGLGDLSRFLSGESFQMQVQAHKSARQTFEQQARELLSPKL